MSLKETLTGPVNCGIELVVKSIKDFLAGATFLKLQLSDVVTDLVA